MHHLLSSDGHLHGLVVPGWSAHSSTEFLVTLFIVAVVVLLQSAVKAAQHAVRTTFNVKSWGRRLLLHSFATLLLAVDALLGYVLMLSVMSGNAWLLLTVLGSSCLGYALFSWVAVPLGPRLRRRYRPHAATGRSDSGVAAQNGGDGSGDFDRAGVAAVAAASSSSGRGQTALHPAEAIPLVAEPAVAATRPRDLADGGAPATANGKSQHVLSTFSTAAAAAALASAPARQQQQQQQQEWHGQALQPDEAPLLDGPPLWHSSAAPAMPAFARDRNGSLAAAGNASSWLPETELQPDVAYGGGGWRGSGGDLYNKYPVLTKYRKLDAEQDGAKGSLELSELDIALRELTSFQQLQA